MVQKFFLNESYFTFLNMRNSVREMQCNKTAVKKNPEESSACVAMQDRGLQGESACYKEVENVLSRYAGCMCVAGGGGRGAGVQGVGFSVIQSYLTLCGPTDYSPPGSSVHGIFQARRLEWDAIYSSRVSFRPRD